MTIASFFFGTLIAIMLGCGFHFWRGGGLKWLILFNLFSFTGFWSGHIVAALLKWKFLNLGPINLGLGVIGTLIFLFAGYWLSMASVELKKQKK
jgi:hypothetical protein